MTELDGKWEAKIKELAKADVVKACSEVQTVICKELCPRPECDSNCAFCHRVINHILMIGIGKEVK
jgi:hypothetical protein